MVFSATTNCASTVSLAPTRLPWPPRHLSDGYDSCTRSCCRGSNWVPSDYQSNALTIRPSVPRYELISMLCVFDKFVELWLCLIWNCIWMLLIILCNLSFANQWWCLVVKGQERSPHDSYKWWRYCMSYVCNTLPLALSTLSYGAFTTRSIQRTQTPPLTFDLDLWPWP